MRDPAVLIENSDKSYSIIQAGGELATIRPVKNGTFKGQFEYESRIALAEHRRGYQPTLRAAVLMLGFKIIMESTPAICYS